MVDGYFQNTLEKHLKFSKNKLSFKRITILQEHQTEEENIQEYI